MTVAHPTSTQPVHNDTSALIQYQRQRNAQSGAQTKLTAELPEIVLDVIVAELAEFK